MVVRNIFKNAMTKAEVFSEHLMSMNGFMCFGENTR